MKTHALVQTTLATLLLALAGCDAAPVAPGLAMDDAAPQFGKLKNDGFERCKPHLNAEEPDPRVALIAIAPDQPVRVALAGDETEGRFRSQLMVRADGSACGQASLEVEIVHAAAGSAVIVFVVGFTGAAVRRDDGRTQVDFEGVAGICPDRGGECETVPMTGSVSELPFEDASDHVQWLFHSPGLMASFPARTSLVTPRGDAGGSVRGSFPLQEVVSRAASGREGPHLFQAEFEVGAAGTASGTGQVWDISDLDNPRVRFVFTVEGGRFVVGPDGVVLVWLSGFMDVVDGRTGAPASFVATARQRPSDDDPIWQFHAGGVYSNSFPAKGELTLQ